MFLREEKGAVRHTMVTRMKTGQHWWEVGWMNGWDTPLIKPGVYGPTKEWLHKTNPYHDHPKLLVMCGFGAAQRHSGGVCVCVCVRVGVRLYTAL